MAIFFWITCMSGGLPGSDPLRYVTSTKPSASSFSILVQSCRYANEQRRGPSECDRAAH